MKSLYKGKVIVDFNSYASYMPAIQLRTDSRDLNWQVVERPHPLEFLPAPDTEEYGLILDAYIKHGRVIVIDDTFINVVGLDGLCDWVNIVRYNHSRKDALRDYLEKLNGT